MPGYSSAMTLLKKIKMTPARSIWAAALAAILTGGAIGVFSGTAVQPARGADQAERPGKASRTLTVAGASLRDRLRVMRGGIVQIHAAAPDLTDLSRDNEDAFAERYPVDRISGSRGSGFVMEAGGLILTSQAVVSGMDAVLVRFADGRTLPGRVVTSSSEAGLAVVAVNAEVPLQALPSAQDDAVEVGDDVHTLIQPAQSDRYSTTQILSIPDRGARGATTGEFLQLSASGEVPQPGSPLFNASGRVIGVHVDSFDHAAAGGARRYAIPIKAARALMQVSSYSSPVRTGRIGVMLEQLEPGDARELGIWPPVGALVAEVDPYGAAAEAGLVPGDVILAIDGRPLQSPPDVASAIMRRVGDTIRVTIFREGMTSDVGIAVLSS